jgi:hypothetical protein
MFEVWVVRRRWLRMLIARLHVRTFAPLDGVYGHLMDTLRDVRAT